MKDKTAALFFSGCYIMKLGKNSFTPEPEKILGANLYFSGFYRNSGKTLVYLPPSYPSLRPFGRGHGSWGGL